LFGPSPALGSFFEGDDEDTESAKQTSNQSRPSKYGGAPIPNASKKTQAKDRLNSKEREDIRKSVHETSRMIRFDSRIMPALHSASDEIIHEKNAVIADLQKRERVAKMEIHKLERQVKTLEKSFQDADNKEKTTSLGAKIEENKLKAEIKQQKVEIARLKEDIFRVKDDMNDQLDRSKREADDRRQEDVSGIERNFMKELNHIKSIHKMEKDQIEHRAQKAVQDLQLLQMDHSKLISNTRVSERDA